MGKAGGNVVSFPDGRAVIPAGRRLTTGEAANECGRILAALSSGDRARAIALIVDRDMRAARNGQPLPQAR
jgi:hypothetical protein